MNYIVIIRGPLGVGKTTISKKLAKKINAEYVSIDKVLEDNYLDLCKGGKCIPVENFITANDIIGSKIRKWLGDGKNVVIDGNFYHKEQIKYFEKNLKNNVFVFTLKCPLDTCILRDKNRPNSYGENATRAVYSLVSRFDYGIDIDANVERVKIAVESIVSHLPK